MGRLWLNDRQMANVTQRVFSLERRATMNNLYHQERLVKLKQEKLQREMEQAHLLRSARHSGSNFLARAGQALRNLLKARKSFQDHRSIEPQAYQIDELVP
jgi:hypothetical protein